MWVIFANTLKIRICWLLLHIMRIKFKFVLSRDVLLLVVLNGVSLPSMDMLLYYVHVAKQAMTWHPISNHIGVEVQYNYTIYRLRFFQQVQQANASCYYRFHVLVITWWAATYINRPSSRSYIPIFSRIILNLWQILLLSKHMVDYD